MIQKCSKCKKPLGSRNTSGLCTPCYQKKYRKTYLPEYRKRSEVKERAKINQRNYREKKEAQKNDNN